MDNAGTYRPHRPSALNNAAGQSPSSAGYVVSGKLSCPSSTTGASRSAQGVGERAGGRRNGFAGLRVRARRGRAVSSICAIRRVLTDREDGLCLVLPASGDALRSAQGSEAG